MLEDSVEGFIATWRPYATVADFFSTTEGSPLLECRVAGVIFHVFERTGPYTAPVGRGEVIIHPVAESVSHVDDSGPAIEVAGISCLKARGRVVYRDDRMLVVDVGVPLVVGVLKGTGEDLAVGDCAAFESLAPVHGFLLPRAGYQPSPMPPAAEEI